MPLLRFLKKLFGHKDDDPKRPKKRSGKKSRKNDGAKNQKSKWIEDSDSSSSDEIMLLESESRSSKSSGAKKEIRGIFIDSSSDDDKNTKKDSKKTSKSEKGDKAETKSKTKDNKKIKTKSSNLDYTDLLSDSASSDSGEGRGKRKKHRSNDRRGNDNVYVNAIEDSASSTSEKDRKKKKTNSKGNTDNVLKDSESSGSEKDKKAKSNKNNAKLNDPLVDSESSASIPSRKKEKKKKNSVGDVNYDIVIKDSESSGSVPAQKQTKSKDKDSNPLKDSESSASGQDQKPAKSKGTNDIPKDSDSSSSNLSKKQRQNNVSDHKKFMSNLINDSESSNDTEPVKATRENKTGNDLNTCYTHKLTHVESSSGGKININTASKKGNTENSDFEITLKDSESSNQKYNAVVNNIDKLSVNPGTENINEKSNFNGNNQLNDTISSNDNGIRKMRQRESINMIISNDIITVPDFLYPYYLLNDFEATGCSNETGQSEKPKTADNVDKDSVIVNDTFMTSHLLDDLNSLNNHNNENDYNMSKSISNNNGRATALDLLKSLEHLENAARKETECSKINDISENNADNNLSMPPSHNLESSDSGKIVNNDEIDTPVPKNIYLSMDDASPQYNESLLLTDDTHGQKTTNNDTEVAVSVKNATKNTKSLTNLELSAIYIDRTAESHGIDYISIISRQMNYSESKTDNKKDNNSSAPKLGVSESQDLASLKGNKVGIDTEKELKNVDDMIESKDANNSSISPHLLVDSKSSDNNHEKKDGAPEANIQCVDASKTLQSHETCKQAVGESSDTSKRSDVISKFCLPLELLDDSESSDSDNNYICDRPALLVHKKERIAKALTPLKNSESSNSDQTSEETVKEPSIINNTGNTVFAVNHLLSQAQDGLEFSDDNKKDNGDTRIMPIGKVREVTGALDLLKESQLLDSNPIDRETDKEYSIADLSRIFKSINENEIIKNDKPQSVPCINNEREKNRMLNPSEDIDVGGLKPRSSDVKYEIAFNNSGIKYANMKNHNKNLLLSQNDNTVDKTKDTNVAKSHNFSQSVCNDQESKFQDDTGKFDFNDICTRKYLKLSHSKADRSPENNDDISKNNNIIIIDNFITPTVKNNDKKEDVAVENIGTIKELSINKTDSTINPQNDNDFESVICLDSSTNDKLDQIKEESDEKVETGAHDSLKGLISSLNAGAESETQPRNVDDLSKNTNSVVFTLPPGKTNVKKSNAVENSSTKAVGQFNNTESHNKSNNNGDYNVVELQKGRNESNMKKEDCETFILVRSYLPISFKPLHNEEAKKISETKSKRVDKVSNIHGTITGGKFLTSTSKRNDIEGEADVINSTIKDIKPLSNTELQNKGNTAVKNSNTDFTKSLTEPVSLRTKDIEDKNKFGCNDPVTEAKLLNIDENIKESQCEILDEDVYRIYRIKQNSLPIDLQKYTVVEPDKAIKESPNDAKPLKVSASFPRRSESISNKSEVSNVAIKPEHFKSLDSGKEDNNKVDDGRNDNLADKYSLKYNSSYSNEINQNMDRKSKSVDNEMGYDIIASKIVVPPLVLDKSKSLEIGKNGNDVKIDDLLKKNSDDANTTEKLKDENSDADKRGEENEVNPVEVSGSSDDKADDAETEDTIVPTEAEK